MSTSTGGVARRIVGLPLRTRRIRQVAPVTSRLLRTLWLHERGVVELRWASITLTTMVLLGLFGTWLDPTGEEFETLLLVATPAAIGIGLVAWSGVAVRVGSMRASPAAARSVRPPGCGDRRRSRRCDDPDAPGRCAADGAGDGIRSDDARLLDRRGDAVRGVDRDLHRPRAGRERAAVAGPGCRRLRDRRHRHLACLDRDGDRRACRDRCRIPRDPAVRTEPATRRCPRAGQPDRRQVRWVTSRSRTSSRRSSTTSRENSRSPSSRCTCRPDATS